MNIRKLLLVSILIIPFFINNQSSSIVAEYKSESVKEKIARIENGIIPFKSVEAIFNPDKNSIRVSLNERMKESKIPGVSIAVIDDYKIDWAKGYGEIRAGSGIKVNDKTYFEAASTTKILTAAVVMKLCELGKLNLDKDVNTYLKKWKIPESVYTKDTKITLRHLLSHQAGLNESEGGFSFQEGKTPTIANVLNGELPAINVPARIEYKPGSKWVYSNFGYIIIQLIIEDHLGMDYSHVMKQYIFEPLGMKRSTFDHPFKEAIKNEVIVPHDKNGVAHDRPLDPTIKAHGDLLTTPSDLARFTIELMRAYQGLDNKLISTDSARDMLSLHREFKSGEMFGLTGYGYGAMILGTGDNFYFLHPGGNMPGANCWLIASPKSGKGAVVMTNAEMGETLMLEIISTIISEYNWPLTHTENK